MKKLLMGLAAVMAAGAASAAWVLGEEYLVSGLKTRTLTDDNWQLTIQEHYNPRGYWIIGVAANPDNPSPDLSVLDLTDFPNDAPFQVVAAGEKVQFGTNAEIAAQLTQFIAPTVTKLDSLESKPMFEKCNALETVMVSSDISYFGTYCFRNCVGLKTINWGAGDKLVTGIGASAFIGCSALEMDLVLPELTATANNAFKGCAKLKTVSLPKCTEIKASCFEECTSITEVSLPLCKTITGFKGCTALTTVFCPEVTTISSSAFQGCTALATFPDTPNLVSLGSSAFQGCTSLKEFVSSTSSLNAFNGSVFRSCSNFEKFWVPNSGESVKSIAGQAFYSIPKLKYFAPTVLPNVTKFGGNDVFESSPIEGDFEFENLTTLTWGSFYNTRITSFKAPKLPSTPAYAFRDNPSLKDVYLPLVTVVGDQSFYGCTSLTNVILSADVTSLGVNAFYKAPLLNLYPMKFDNLTLWGGALFANSTRCPLPGTLEVGFAADEVALTRQYEFYGLTNIEAIVFNTSVTNFGYCSLGYLRPGVDIYFKGASSLGPKSLGYQCVYNNQSAKWTRFHVCNKAALPGWQTLCADFADAFASSKTRSDYPGKSTIGVIPVGTDNKTGNWVTNLGYVWIINDCPASGTLLTVM